MSDTLLTASPLPGTLSPRDIVAGVGLGVCRNSDIAEWAKAGLIVVERK